MATCPECGHENRDSALICAQCGEILIADLHTLSQTSTLNVEAVAEKLRDLPTIGTASFSSQNRLRLDFPENIVVVNIAEKLYLGRDIHEVDVGSSLNLTPYGAYAGGVSRLHAEISLVDNNYLQLTDLHSTNGTFLNGEQLKPLRPYRLHDGDYIRLGKLAVTIHYEVENA
jgi:hypothetical protein